MNTSEHLPKNFLFGSSCFSLRSGQSTKDDFSILEVLKPCRVSFVSTKNIFCGEPVKLARKKFSLQKKYRGLAVNVGQANVGTGEKGYQDAEKICSLVAEKFGCNESEIFSLSTGVIGKPIKMDNIKDGIKNNFPKREHSAEKFSEGILSTDLVPKTAWSALSSGEKIFGIAKGVGMLEPNMGTMLSVVVSDANIPADIQQEIWKRVVEKSYNCISVDSDMSTSDMGFLWCSADYTKQTNLQEFEEKLLQVCQTLAQKIAQDGEGATKLLEIEVINADTEKNAKILAKSVVNSPLWKSAVFGNDPNWGRILAALGKTQIPFNPEKISVAVQNIDLFQDGEIQNFDEKSVSKKMSENKKVFVKINMNMGEKSCSVWGCDLSYEYVKINAEYRT